MTIKPKLVVERWQYYMGPVPDAKKLDVDITLGPPQSRFSMSLTASNVGQLAEAAQFVKQQLEQLCQAPGISVTTYILGAKILTLVCALTADSLRCQLSQVASSQVRAGLLWCRSSESPARPR